MFSWGIMHQQNQISGKPVEMRYSAAYPTGRERIGDLNHQREGANMPVTMMLKEIASYPVEDRIMMADAIIESLNGYDLEVDAAWNAVSLRRLGELRTGKVKGIPASTVLARARALCRA